MSHYHVQSLEERPLGLLAEQVIGGLLEQSEGPGDGRQVGLSVVGQQQGAVEAAEQLALEPLLQGLDLVADGRLGDVQLLGGAGEAQMPRRGLEGAQSVERRQALGHGYLPYEI